jgi:hypothetical protein
MSVQIKRLSESPCGIENCSKKAAFSQLYCGAGQLCEENLRNSISSSSNVNNTNNAWNVNFNNGNVNNNNKTNNNYARCVR